MARERLEAGDTLQFTFVSSVAPDAAPSFAVYTSSATLLSSQTAQTSGTTAYYAMFTMPSSADGVYLWEWRALKTVVGSAFQFTRRETFLVDRTMAES